VLGQLFQTGVGDVHALLAFVGEAALRPRHGQRAQRLGHLRHHRCSTGAGAATHAGSDEDHVRAAQGVFDALRGFPRPAAADVRLHAGAQTGITDLDDVMRLGR
jgi:hypothetical protein